MTPSGLEILRISPKILAVMPIEVAVQMVPRKSASGAMIEPTSGWSRTVMPAPRKKEAITPPNPTTEAFPLKRRNVGRSVSNPLVKSKRIEPTVAIP